jgi:hypothetical protein
MSDSSAPRRAELFLGSLGAESEFCDAIVGDLAEELAIRTAWDGEAVARRWYYRETVRVAPHLLRNWWSSLRLPDLGYFANVVALSLLFVFVLAMFSLLTMQAFAHLFGVSFGSFGRWWDNPAHSIALPVFMSLWGVGNWMCGGYIAAWLGRRAPFPSALALGAAGVSIGVVLSAVGSVPAHQTPAPMWFRVGSMMIVLTSTIAGGLLRASSQSAHEDAAELTSR